MKTTRAVAGGTPAAGVLFEAAALAQLEKRGLAHLARAVEERTGVPLSSILGRDRHKSIAAARHELFALLRTDGAPGGLSLNEIADLLGLDHTTVLSGIRSHQRRCAEPGFRAVARDMPDLRKAIVDGVGAAFSRAS